MRDNQELQNRTAIITPGVAASILGVSSQTLRHYVLQGKIAAVSKTPGNQSRYRLSDVLLLLEDKKKQEEQPPPDPETLASFTESETPVLAELFKGKEIKL